MPLPRSINRLLLVSAVLSTTAFILSMTHSLGSDSIWTVPGAWILTIAHHITVYVLSRRRSGPPPLPDPDEPSPIKNSSRASVYHPASKSSSVTVFSSTAETEDPSLEESERRTVAPVSRDNVTGSASPKYPSFTLTGVNCIATCLLAMLWTIGAVLPVPTYSREESAAIYFVRNFFPIPEAGVMWAIFVLFIRARNRRMREGEFVRMDNC
jgi:hypothetical protein